MNNDLISRAALSEELSSLTMTITGLRAGKGILHEFMTEYRKTVLRIVDDAPAVDAEPVRHGRWERMDEYCNHSKTFRCSVCKGNVEYSYFTRFCEYDYCPNCGAKMDLEVQDD